MNRREILLAGVGGVALCNLAQAHPLIEQFDYSYLDCPYLEFGKPEQMAELNKKGQEGWSIAAVNAYYPPCERGPYRPYRCILRRSNTNRVKWEFRLLEHHDAFVPGSTYPERLIRWLQPEGASGWQIAVFTERPYGGSFLIAQRPV